jgi:proliferating cell nuclear antigen
MARDEDIIFEAKTVQTSNIKTLFEILKEVLVDLNIVITKDKIKVVALNSTEISLIHVKLNAEAFESYYCDRTDENPLILGIHTDNIFKIIKTIKHDETISFYVTKKDPHHLFIRKENNTRNSINTFKVELYEITSQMYSIPEVDFQTMITMSSIEFQKLCKDYYGLGAKKLEIKTVDQQLFFSSTGDFSSFEAILGNSNNTSFSNDNRGAIVQGEFDIKWLLLFSKASNLSITVELYLKNDYPLIMNYKIGTLGDLRFIVSGINDS